MSLQLNHTIVAARDGQAAARWFADLFGLAAPTSLGVFWQIETDNGVGMDFATAAGESAIAGQHYAFLVSEDDFTAIYRRITDRGIDHWADPHQHHPGQINTHDGGRGVYFLSPDGHFLEILTRPYGSGA
jgi:catechol 2,3-dioxygenase-like lactoylglutathione lyase family enzyme